jgi:hypothetical protein
MEVVLPNRNIGRLFTGIEYGSDSVNVSVLQKQKYNTKEVAP